MSTQQYYQPPGAYIPQRAPPPPQRQQLQYNPASYNPALYHQQHPQHPQHPQQPQGPPSPPAISVTTQPGHGGYAPYVPHGGAPGRTTPQPVVGRGGYVPYANIQGVIGGVNRSAAVEQSGEEAPPPYSPPQRPLNRQPHMSPPTLAVPNAAPVGHAGPGCSQYQISPSSSGSSPLTPLSGISVSTQGTIYTPITPNTGYQPHSTSPAPNTNAARVQQQIPQQQQILQPQQPQYMQQDPNRMSSPPVHYHHNAIQQQAPPPPPAQQPHHHHHSGSISQSLAIPAYGTTTTSAGAIPSNPAGTSSTVAQSVTQGGTGSGQAAQRRMVRGVPPISTTNLHPSGGRSREWEDSIETPVSPSTLQRASTISGMGRRDRDSLALRRSTNLQTIPQAATPPNQPQNTSPPGGLPSGMAIPPPPPGPPPGPPPAQTVVTSRRSTSEVRATSAGLAPGSSTTPLTASGSATLPNGMAVPPPPSQPPRKPVLIQPAPLGKKRAAARAAVAGEGSNSEASSSHAEPPKTPGSAGLALRRASSPQPPISSSGAPQPQSILRSQKSSGDLASAGGLKSTTPKDVRFVIPDEDESEYESTADGESVRDAASPGFALSGAPTPRTPASADPTKQQDSKNGAYGATMGSSGISSDDYFDDSRMRSFQEARKTAIGLPAWGNEKEKSSGAGALPAMPMSAPASETRFHAAPTPPFSPDSSGPMTASEEKAMLKKLTSAESQLPTPPIRNIQGNNTSPTAVNSPPADATPQTQEDDEDLPPFYHEAIGRHNDMILSEAAAASDEKRLNLFVDFVMEEARMRGQMYNNALGVLGPGLQLFPSGDPRHMTPEEEVMAFERAQAQRIGITPLKRTSTIKEQKSKEKARERASSSVPNTPRDFSGKRGSWFDTARGVGEGSWSSSKGGPVVASNGEMYYPEGVYPPEKPFKFEESLADLTICGDNSIDIEPLLSRVPAFPRQFPASENSHPALQKIRRAISELKDLTDLHRIKFEFVASEPRIQDANAAEARMRKAQHQDDTQRLFNEGNVTYEEMDELHAKFEREEGERKTDDLKQEFERFQTEVVSLAHSELMDRVEQLTALMEEIQIEITTGASSSFSVREGPELLERLNLLRTAFEAREQLHLELKNIISDRNKKYKEVVIAPFINDRDHERIMEAEEFFDDDAKQFKVKADEEALERMEKFLAKVEGNVIRGVEMEVSSFWDLAPGLTEILEKIPENLSGFRPVIPEDEYLMNPGYHKFPLQYLRTKLEYAGNSIYQHAQAQMRLLGFSMDITVMWNNAKWSLKNSQRVAAGEAEKTTEWQLERQKKEEELRQTKDWEEKMKTVKEEWSQSVGNKLNETKRRIKEQLVNEGGWGQDWIEKNHF